MLLRKLTKIVHQQPSRIDPIWAVMPDLRYQSVEHGSTRLRFHSSQVVNPRARGRVAEDVTTSTMIQEARYWPEDRALELSFVGGRRYLYLGVPLNTAKAFQTAPSKGAYFNERIKGRYRCHELASAAAPRRRRAVND
jgi:hypothetical protein